MKFGKGLRSAAAMVLSAATLLAMGAIGVGTANAADDTTYNETELASKTGKITISDVPTGHTLKYVKLAHYTYATGDSTSHKLSGVSLSTESSVLNQVKKAAETAGASGATYDASNPMAWVAQLASSGTAPYSGTLRDFVTALAKGDLPSITAPLNFNGGTALTPAGNTATATVPVGIYAIGDVTDVSTGDISEGKSDSIPMIVSTPIGDFNKIGTSDTALGEATMKNQQPTLTQKATAINGEAISGGANQLDNVRVGDKVEFTLTTAVPNTVGFDDFVFDITDTLPDGLSYNNDAVMKLGGIQSTLFNDSSTGSELKFSIGDSDHGVASSSFVKDKAITITYSATLQKTGASWKMKSNTAELDYSNDALNPGGTGPLSLNPSLGKVKATSVDIATYSITLTNTKHDGTSPLDNGSFTVWNGNTQLKFTRDGDGRYIYDKDSTSTDAMATIHSGTTPNDKYTIVFDGLPTGTYEIKQATSHSNYTRADFKVTIGSDVDGTGSNPFSITKADTVNGIESTGANSITRDTGNAWNGLIIVKNIDSITQLPITGGVGVALVLLLALISAGVVVVTSKMRRNNLVNARK
ncbi:isopeptide-forming domain-containing fimbrial protein [Bifidobacterium sp. ESL0745]|uniref:isopeptide-forming domain-containing fimbrial protein n=1 Tax=Bifidobacterium sp. ESL0745 TaxID=2983226 RepID=UPI0023FA17B4|nr:isopeptide-forming domain-containing fimbrial protein [Bifidobacterium sp. ESL0745]MDF7665944.1 isopeptide-forming domain-containing fimbrial protein [Bifidobacterium sp. ESL0745]